MQMIKFLYFLRSVNYMQIILDGDAMRRTLLRLSHQIIEKNKDSTQLHIVGICRRGVCLADIIADNIKTISDKSVTTGKVDVTLYRDDVLDGSQPAVHGTDIPFDVNGKIIILVDDVLYTGRTARAAIDAIIKLGRPACIQYAVLVDRGHRELPIRGDFVGKNIPTHANERVYVQVPEYDNEFRVIVS